MCEKTHVLWKSVRENEFIGEINSQKCIISCKIDYKKLYIGMNAHKNADAFL